MNPTLARLYGTGMSKTASAGEIDLSQISAADYLELLNGQEKVANEDEIDLSQLSAQELIDLAAELETEDPIEKMASSGELSYWDAAGRVMAHAYADEMSKVAGTDLPEIINVDELSAQELVELIESGEYDIEKVAVDIKALKAAGASADVIRNAMKNAMNDAPAPDRGASAVAAYNLANKAPAKRTLRGLLMQAKMQGRYSAQRGGELLSAKNVRANVNELAGTDATMKEKLKTYGNILRGSAGNDMMTSEARKSLAAQGLGVVVGKGALGGGAYLLHRKSKKKS